MDIFNNREIALGFWLIAGILWAAFNASVRASFGDVWKAFCSPKILVPLGLMAAYITVLVFGLSEAGLWGWAQLKNTVLWSLSVAAVSLFRVPKIAEDEHYFWHAIRDNFKVIAVLEFVIAFYTLPLWAELLLVPIATILVGMQVVAQGKAEYAPARLLIDWLLTALGGGLVVFAGYKLVTDFGSFAQAGTLSDFALPIALTLLFLPFLYVLALYVSYENAFARLNLTFHEPPLRHYAKRTALFRFHVRAHLLRRWLRNIQMRTPGDRAALRASIAQVKELARRSKAPAAVPPEEGWSPYLAREFLSEDGLVPNDYHQDPIDDAAWFAASPYFEIGEAILPNNIAYYVEGDEHVARRLKLVVNFNDQETAKETRERFAGLAENLFHRALDKDPPEAVRASILQERPHSLAVDDKTILLTRDSWPSGRGYEMHFIVQVRPSLD